VTSKSIKIGLRKPPRVFTEYGVAMVSSIINYQRAVEVSVQIIQAFVYMKKAMMHELVANTGYTFSFLLKMLSIQKILL
jgi:hypothetical protein